MIKNIDQQQKVINGKLCEANIEERLKRIADGVNVIYIGRQPSCFGVKMNDLGYLFKHQIQMDHAVMIPKHTTKQLLVLFNDSTTTHRGERIKVKGCEGFVQSILHSEIKKRIIDEFPQFYDYEVIDATHVTFPDEVNRTLKNPRREENKIESFCHEINYQAHQLSTQSNVHMIDGAFRVAQWLWLIQEIASNKEKYNFSKGLMTELWRESFSNDKFMPLLGITIENIEKHKDELLYGINNNWNKYMSKDYKDTTISQIENIGMTNIRNCSKKVLQKKLIDAIEQIGTSSLLCA